MIFQEFLNNIIDNGEISLIIIGGKYTHAVKKIAKKGDFRVQDDHGGKVIEYQPSMEEIKFAEKCIEICQNILLCIKIILNMWYELTYIKIYT